MQPSEWLMGMASMRWSGRSTSRAVARRRRRACPLAGLAALALAVVMRSGLTQVNSTSFMMTPMARLGTTRSRRLSATLLVSSLAFLALSAGAATPAQAACTPNSKTNAADPGIVTSGNNYKLVHTGSLTAPILESTDGESWCPKRQVFAQDPSWVTGHASAPDFSPDGSVVVYSATRAEPKMKPEALRQCIGFGMLGADEMYHPAGEMICGYRGRRVSLIDASIFETHGKRYLLYKVDFKKAGSDAKRIVIRRMSSPVSVASERKHMRTLLAPKVPKSAEAPTMVHRGDWYYLFYSSGNYKTRSYEVKVRRSRSVTRGFNTRLSGPRSLVGGKRSGKGRCGVGHQDVVHPPGPWRMYFHYGTMHGRECVVTPRFLDYRFLRWRHGWPEVYKGKPQATTSSQTTPAAKTCVRHPHDASVACVRNGGRTLDVCDRSRDGHRAYARVVTQASTPGFQSPFYDTNGATAGCANLPFTSTILSVAICVQTEGCSTFKPTGLGPAPPQPAPPAPPPAPPSAKDVCAGHPSDPSVVCVRNAGHTVDVCDRDPDGHRAYARVVTQASSPGFLSPFYDGNDSQPGCSNVPFPDRVLSVAVCVQNEGCGPYKPT